MPRKPRSANDNQRKALPMQRYVWDVYRAAARARWVGRVIAPNPDAAIEAAAVEFNTAVKKLPCGGTRSRCSLLGTPCPRRYSRDGQEDAEAGAPARMSLRISLTPPSAAAA